MGIQCQNRKMGCLFEANTQQDLTIHLYTCIPNLIDNLQYKIQTLRQLHQDKDKYIEKTGFVVPAELQVSLSEQDELPSGGEFDPIPIVDEKPTASLSGSGSGKPSTPIMIPQSDQNQDNHNPPQGTPSVSPTPTQGNGSFRMATPTGANASSPTLKPALKPNVTTPNPATVNASKEKLMSAIATNPNVISPLARKTDSPKLVAPVPQEAPEPSPILQRPTPTKSLSQLQSQTAAQTSPQPAAPSKLPQDELAELYADKNWYCPNIYARSESESALSSSGHSQSFMIRMSGSVEGAQVISRYINALNQYSHNIILPVEGGFQLHDTELDPKVYPTIGDIANYSPCLEGFVPYVLTPEEGVRFIQLINELRSKNLPVPTVQPTPKTTQSNSAAQMPVKSPSPQPYDQDQFYDTNEVLYENTENWALDYEDVRRKIEPIMKEIILTERDYVTDLNILVRFYYEPMTKLASKISPKEDIDRLFSNLLDLTQISKDLLVTLEKSKKETKGNLSPGGYAASLLQHIGALSAYGKYCSSYHRWITNGDLLSKLKSNTNFAVFEEEALKVIPDPKKKLPLEAFLIKPVQRLTKYPLFFSQLLKEMKGVPECQDEVEILEQGQEAINQLVAQVNTETKELETEVRTQAILQNLEGFENSDLIGKKVLADINTELIINFKGMKRGERIKVVLFKDLLLYAKIMKNKMKYKGSIEFTQVRLIDIADSPEIKNHISIEDRIGGDPLDVSCASLMEKKNFMDQYNALLKVAYQKSSSKLRAPSYSRSTGNTLLSQSNSAHNSPAQLSRRLSQTLINPNGNSNNNTNTSPSMSTPASPRQEFGDSQENYEPEEEPQFQRRPTKPPARPPPTQPQTQPKPAALQGFSYFGPVAIKPAIKPAIDTRGKPPTDPLKYAKPARLSPQATQPQGSVLKPMMKPANVKPSATETK